jgi:hypothetical protein
VRFDCVGRQMRCFLDGYTTSQMETSGEPPKLPEPVLESACAYLLVPIASN